MKKIVNIVFIIFYACLLMRCDNFIDVVPDKRGTIDKAFELREQAKKALYTTYSYLPVFHERSNNPAFLSGDEMWLSEQRDVGGFEIALGNQKIVQPYQNFWEGQNGGQDIYEGIRQCNIFLDNINSVPNMTDAEKNRWTAEVKFLKAYYHFYLIRMYGPIILAKNNVPVSTPTSDLVQSRAPLDSCFSYVVQLLDEAINTPELPDVVTSEQTELGRITKAIAYAVKAKVLVTEASPLFNGNSDYRSFKNVNGVNLFDTKFDASKWDTAAAAAKKAVDFAESVGFKLYKFNPQFSQYDLSDSTTKKLTIRNSFTIADQRNPEGIWVIPNYDANRIQRDVYPQGLDPLAVSNTSVRGWLAPPIKIAEMFYTEHGVPIDEDTSWDYANRYKTQQADSSDRYYIRQGRTTAKLNFDREPRYYADLGFDGSIWYGQGKLDDSDPANLYYVQNKAGEAASKQRPNYFSITGYFVKKLVNYKTLITKPGESDQVNTYAWPLFRLSDLYLLYAEAKNEADGPGATVREYVDKVRSRASLPTVEDAWTNYSSKPNKYTTKEGMREIIHQERLIELSFEAQRYWDLRRWKEATDELNKPITGWDIEQSTNTGYYRVRTLYNQTFSTKDYLWPISEDELLSNTKLTQNPGW